MNDHRKIRAVSVLLLPKGEWKILVVQLSLERSRSVTDKERCGLDMRTKKHLDIANPFVQYMCSIQGQISRRMFYVFQYNTG